MRRGDGPGRLGTRADVRAPAAPTGSREAEAGGGASRWRTRWCATRSRLPGTGPVAFGSFSFAAESAAGATLVVPEVVVGRRGGAVVGDHDRRRRRPAGARRAGAQAPPPAPSRRWRFADGALSPARSGPAPSPRRCERISAAASWTRWCWPATCVVDARRADRPPLAAAAAGRALRHDLGLRGRRPRRRDAGAARAAARRAWSPRASWPARSAVPATTTHDLALAGVAGALAQGPRGARVRRALGRRRAGAALLVDERARGAVRPAPVQRHAPGHRRRRGPRRRRRPRWRSPRRCTRRPPCAARPTDVGRRRSITELERMDRGRYAGPVGWMDAAGDGEWGIALRCGAFEPEDAAPDAAVRRAAASSPGPTPRPSWPSPTPSSCRCATR